MPLKLDIDNNHNATTWKDRRVADWQPWPHTPIKAKFLELLDSYITVPPFHVDPIDGLFWNRVFKIYQFNYSSPHPFTFKEYQVINMQQDGDAGFFTLVVRWRDSNGVTHRYKIWEDAFFTDNLPFIPTYMGELIQPNFSLEVWSIPGVTGIINGTAKKILTSITFPPAGIESYTPVQLVPESSEVSFPQCKFTLPNFSIPIPIDSRVTFLGN